MPTSSRAWPRARRCARASSFSCCIDLLRCLPFGLSSSSSPSCDTSKRRTLHRHDANMIVTARSICGCVPALCVCYYVRSIPSSIMLFFSCANSEDGRPRGHVVAGLFQQGLHLFCNAFEHLSGLCTQLVLRQFQVFDGVGCLGLELPPCPRQSCQLLP